MSLSASVVSEQSTGEAGRSVEVQFVWACCLGDSTALSNALTGEASSIELLCCLRLCRRLALAFIEDKTAPGAFACWLCCWNPGAKHPTGMRTGNMAVPNGKPPLRICVVGSTGRAAATNGPAVWEFASTICPLEVALPSCQDCLVKAAPLSCHEGH